MCLSCPAWPGHELRLEEGLGVTTGPHSTGLRSFRAMRLRITFQLVRASLVAQTVKNLPAMQETWVQSLVWEDPLEEGMATHSNILALRIPWTEEPGGRQTMKVTESQTRLRD